MQKINGINGSYAQLNHHGVWQIHGAHNVLDDQQPDTYIYKINRPFAEVIKLPMDTPIYSAEGPEADMGYYEDIADLIHNAQRLLRDYVSYADVDEQYQPIAHPANNVEAILQVAQVLFDGVTWQTYDSYIQDVENDIEENPDIYDKIFIKQY